jgi:hypothetical protein
MYHIKESEIVGTCSRDEGDKGYVTIKDDGKKTLLRNRRRWEIVIKRVLRSSVGSGPDPFGFGWGLR